MRSADRRCPISLAPCAGAYWRLRRPSGRRFAFGPEAPGSIPRRRHPGFHQPPGLCADARRVLVPFTAHYSCSWRGVSPRPNGPSSDGRVLTLEARAAHDGQRRVAWEARIGRRAFTAAERGASARRDHAGVAARAAQAGGWAVPGSMDWRCVGHQRTPCRVAERVGFEPTKSFDSALFKSAAINRSATSPAPQDSGRPSICGWALMPAARSSRARGTAGAPRAR